MHQFNHLNLFENNHFDIHDPAVRTSEPMEIRYINTRRFKMKIGLFSKREVIYQGIQCEH